MILTTERLRLRPMEPEDIDPFVQHLNDWEIQQWLMAPPFPYRRADGEAFLAIVQGNHAGPWATVFVIADKTDGDPMGVIGIDTDGAGGSDGELGYWLARDHWGRGLTKEAARALLHHARQHPTLRRLWASTDPANIRSQRVLSACGFTDCGLRDRIKPARRNAAQVRRFELRLAEQ